MEIILKIFIDTEFTDFIDTHLISLAMVAESGEEFYAEVPYPESTCSAFVREAVIPLLGAIPNASCSVADLCSKMTTWLESIKQENERIEICYDYQGDWDLFADALNYQVPPWCKPRLINSNINKLLSYEFHLKNGLPEHHALYDARANKYSYRER